MSSRPDRSAPALWIRRAATVNPHALRKTLVRLGQARRLSPEEWKAWSQNFGHESEFTTFVGYGHVPNHRQAEIMHLLAKPAQASVAGLDLDSLQAFLDSAKGSCSG
jgi:hypothetical protein